MISRSALALAAAALLFPGVARADDEQAARALFLEAEAAVDSGRLAEGRDLLRQSLELAPLPESAFFLGVVHRAMGETTAAADVFARLAAGAFGTLEPGRRSEVDAMLAEVRAELATLAITVRGSPAEVRVDGGAAGRLADGAETRRQVDAGRHVIVATTPGGRSRDRTVEATRGELLRVLFTLPRDPPPARPDEEGSSVFASPWLWIGAVAIIAGGVALTLVLTAGDDPGPPSDPVWGSAMPLTR